MPDDWPVLLGGFEPDGCAAVSGCREFDPVPVELFMSRCNCSRLDSLNGLCGVIGLYMTARSSVVSG